MPFKPPANYWIQIPAGRYRVGLTTAEAHSLATQNAVWMKQQGPQFSLDEGKAIARSAALAETAANPTWVEAYLLAHHPTREVTLPAFAIARRPITNRELRDFQHDTGESQPAKSWDRDKKNQEPELPAQGLGWWQALAIANWAKSRLPFEDEWERSVRGPSHTLFPWGNELGGTGIQILEHGYDTTLPTATTKTSEGLEGSVRGSPEWCADLWHPLADPNAWGEDNVPGWARLFRGGPDSDKIIASALGRASAHPNSYGYTHDTASVRLVRADDRAMPSASLPRDEAAMGELRQFESVVLHQVFAALERSPITRDHTIELNWSGRSWTDPAVTKVISAVRDGARNARSGVDPDPSVWVTGESVIATSRESVRRIPKEHGVYVWNMQYRLASDGLRARPVTAFRLAADKGLHRFENRFRREQPDTLVSELTPELVRTSILDAFQYYEIHADSDHGLQ